MDMDAQIIILKWQKNDSWLLCKYQWELSYLQKLKVMQTVVHGSEQQPGQDILDSFFETLAYWLKKEEI